MLRINHLSVPLDWTEASLRSLLLKKCRLDNASLLSFRIEKKSVDARDRNDVHFVLNVLLEVADEQRALKRCRLLSPVTPEKRPSLPAHHFQRKPVVVGSGPAGLFAALTLARAGASPLLIERGKPVEKRVDDVRLFQESGILNTESNIQFGEGGAGTFSDGKLTCGIKSPWIGEVLETFVAHGAPPDILYEQKPHIGTDLLKGIVSSIRHEIESLGGRVLFETRFEKLVLRGSRLAGILVHGPEGKYEIPTDTLLLCIGHSARDTISGLFSQGILMEAKPFAIGVRIEHPAAMINRAQYGSFADHPALGTATYKMNCHTPDGRGVYTFCMCPGGEVIAASSLPEAVVTNGMSLHARSGINSNSALLVGVRPEDFGGNSPLAGFSFQQKLEEQAYRAAGGGYRAPSQRLEDFLAERPSSHFGSVVPSYRPGTTPSDLRAVLPDYVLSNLRFAIPFLDRILHGFALPDAVLTAPETRSSSPVRLLRTEAGESVSCPGLFPAGEGAGYAGGIVSAAVDGIRAARSALLKSEAS